MLTKEKNMTLEQALKRPDENGQYGEVPVGTLIIMADGRRLLVGHINQLGGVCDDCTNDMKADVSEILDPNEDMVHLIS